MHYKPQSGQFLVTEKSARHNTRRSDSECQQTASSPTINHPHRPTTCYLDFAPSSASAPFLTLVRLRGTDYQKTFARNMTSLTFENFLKLTILILCLTFNNCTLSLYCNGRTRKAVSMSVWVCKRPHYFYCASPDFTTSIVSQSVTNNRCAPSCGGTREKWGPHQKIFGRRFAPALCPHLQIASDATDVG